MSSITSNVKRLYVNACSILNKWHYLCTNVRVLEPDTIGITETRLNDKVNDAEVVIEGYDLFRSEFPEQMWCKTEFDKNNHMLVGVCYKTATEQVW